MVKKHSPEYVPTCGTKMFRIGGGGVKKVVKATAKEGKKGTPKAKVKAKAKSKRK